MGNKAARKYVRCPDARREANEAEWEKSRPSIDVKGWLDNDEVAVNIRRASIR